MLSDSIYATLVLLATLAAATPLPEATSAPLRKRVIAHELPPRLNRLQRRDETTNTSVVDFGFLNKEVGRINNKYTYHNGVWQQNHVKLNKRSNPMARIAARSKEPFDIAQHRRRKRQQVASVSLTDDVELGTDVSYYSQNLEIGTPQQTFSIDFDTGSSDLWVFGEDAVTSSSAGNGSPFAGGSPLTGNSSSDQSHATFSPSSSSTNTLSSKTFSITYGTGETDGRVTQDTVTLNGLTVPKQVFGVATTVSDDFTEAPFDGLMGIGFSAISQVEANTWTENLVLDDLIPSDLFSVQLERGSATVSRSADSTQVLNDQSGMVIFGAIDSDMYQGSLVYSPVTIQAYWQADIQGFGTKGQVIDGTSCGAAFDTGTSLVYVPTTVAANLAAAIGASPYSGASAGQDTSGYYTMPCEDITKADISLSFANTLFSFNGADLNAGRVNSRLDLCMLTIIGADTTDPKGNPLAIVGDAFLKNVVAVFDYSNGVRIGMAAQKSSSSATSNTGSSTGQNDTASSASTLTSSLLLCLLALVALA